MSPELAELGTRYSRTSKSIPAGRRHIVRDIPRRGLPGLVLAGRESSAPPPRQAIQAFGGLRGDAAGGPLEVGRAPGFHLQALIDILAVRDDLSQNPLAIPTRGVQKA